jgi:hypothetical protein
MTLTFIDTRTGLPADVSEYGMFQSKGCMIPSHIRLVDADTGQFAGYGNGMGSNTALFVYGGLAVAAFGAYRRHWPLASFGMALAIFGQGASA